MHLCRGEGYGLSGSACPYAEISMRGHNTEGIDGTGAGGAGGIRFIFIDARQGRAWAWNLRGIRATRTVTRKGSLPDTKPEGGRLKVIDTLLTEY